MLSPYRVIDLCCERGILCGQILADLGAEVIAVEPRGGSSARQLGPFLDGRPGPERSLFWRSYARGKRSVALDLETETGRAALRRLAAGADFLLESHAPGWLEERGLGYDALAATNPGLVYVSITPFGQHGPKAHYTASDLVVLAAGGPLALGGDSDRPPVRVALPQAFLHAGAEAAGAALIAHHERVRSGRGQHVDVSAQQAVAQAAQSMILASSLGENEALRAAGGVRLGPLEVRLLWPAADGHVAITLLFGLAIGPFTRRLMEWICEEGGCDEATRDKDWLHYNELMLSGSEPISEYERLKLVVESFTKQKTKAELQRAALERRLLIAPVNTIADIAASDQLAARDYWRELEDREGGRRLRYPGPFARSSARPIGAWRPAPRVGGDTRELLTAPPRSPVRVPSADAAPASDALSGVKVLDLMWVMAGPAATRVLADYGATVVRVESSQRVETGRTIGPFRGSAPGPENSGLFQNMNAGKLGIALDLGSPAGREVVLDLVRWADVVTESFSPRAMKGWGLGYEELRRVKPDLVMLSSCLMGQTGPLAQFAGFGNLAAAWAGFFGLAGWPDRAPAGPFGAYTDYVSPRFAVAALLAALDHRRRTGEGQYLDLSQAEASLHFLAPALLDHAAHGRVATRCGNEDASLAPHGVYPAAGDDRWVAIAVTGEGEWRELCSLLGRPDLRDDGELATAGGRRARCEDLDAAISAWTRARDAHESERLLQARGVAAHAVQTSTDCASDPQLRHRGHFVELPHPLHGTFTVEGSRARLSRTPARVVRCGPTLGRDADLVLREILGYDDARIRALSEAGALR